MENNFKDNFNELLANNELDVNKLSKVISLKYKVLSNYSKGDDVPNIKNALIIANYFKCRLDFLFGLTDDNSKYKFSKPDFLFYKRYLETLKKRNCTHYKLTGDIGLNINDSRRWKNGSIPKSTTLVKIAKELGVSIDYLIGRNVIK